MNDPNHVEAMRESYRAVVEHLGDVVSLFYSMLFSRHPELKPLFANTDLAAQRVKLVNSISFIIQNLQMPHVLEGALREMGERHRGYGVKPEHYAMVSDCLIDALSVVAGEKWRSEMTLAWRVALDAISNIMMQGHETAAVRAS